MIYRETTNGPMIFQENDITGSFLGHCAVQQPEIDFLYQIISEGDVMMDIGAGIGTITIPMAKRIGLKGYVLSLEAHSMLFYTLCGNLALNELSHVQVFNRAASDRTGSMFYFPHFDYSKNQDYGSIRLSGLLNFKDEQERSYDNPVTSVALDDLGIANPKLIKIDVNGMEPVVLNGLRRTIKRSKPILLIDFRENWQYIFEYLNSVGYDWALFETPLFESGAIVSHDIVCWHRTNKPNLDNPYIVNLESSQNLRHIQIKEAKSNADRAADFSIEPD
jgi:FkbM family methyltransferase